MARDNQALRLRTIAEELASIASRLRPDIAEQPMMPVATDNLGEYAQLPPPDRERLTEYARIVYRARRCRARAFGDESLFGEPAWDLLLDLFIAQSEGKHLSVSAACIGAAVPTSTALRWIVILESRGLVRRENDSTDARRVFLHLTPDGYETMTRYFIQLQREIAL
ncbi:MAG: MarR family transcriptional regulator [Novosphingobium sp.]|nr:MarR family transcriptional regulator [Novosphingobium sp.]